jgi:hypothetical protein
MRTFSQVESELLFYNGRTKCRRNNFWLWGICTWTWTLVTTRCRSYPLRLWHCGSVFRSRKSTIIKILQRRIYGGALKLWDPKHVNFLLFRGCPPFFKISGFTTVKSGVELNKLGVIGGHRWHYRGSGSFHYCPLRHQTLSDNKLKVLASSLYFV